MKTGQKKILKIWMSWRIAFYFNMRNKKHGSSYSFEGKSPFTCFLEISPSENLQGFEYARAHASIADAGLYAQEVRAMQLRGIILSLPVVVNTTLQLTGVFK